MRDVISRMWINQPSTHQPLHALHGTNVLYDEKTSTAYFTQGNIVSMIISKIHLSKGWKQGA